ncbi:YoaK family protein [Aerococcus vaginalis]
MRHRQHAVTQTVPFGLLLTLNNGMLTTFTYLYGDGAFAGFQTGNSIRMAVDLGKGDFQAIWPLLFSMICFILGIVVSRALKYVRFHHLTMLWRHRLNVIIMLLGITLAWLFYNQLPIALMNGMLSFGAAIQFEEFQILKGRAATFLMMTGNLRKMTRAVVDMVLAPSPHAKNKVKDSAKLLAIIMFGYIFGALVISFLSQLIAHHVIILPLFTTLALLGMLFLPLDQGRSAIVS